MGYQVTFAPRAIEDLRAIVEFIALDDPVKAVEFGRLLTQKTRVLKSHPEIGRVVPEFGDDDIREVIYRQYRIVYRLKRSEQLVEISRFWHGARGAMELPS